jgi:hypothetical protein
MDADRVIVELLAKTDGFDAKVRQSAALNSVSMKEIETSTGRAEGAHVKLASGLGNTSAAMMEFQHVARAATGQIAAGTPLTQILGQHMGQLGQSVSLAGGAMGRFGAIMSGPWGLAMTLGISLLSIFALKHRDTADSVDDLIKKLGENADKAAKAEMAEAQFEKTIKGLNEALRKHRELLNDANEATKSFAEQQLDSAQKQVANTQAIIASNIALLEHARALAAIQKVQSQAPGTRGELATLAADQASGQVALFDQQIAEAKKTLAGLEGVARDWASRVASETGERLADPVQVVRDKYKGLIEDTRKRLLAEKANTAEIQKQTKALAEKRDAEIKAIRDQDKHTRGESGKEVTASEAAAIARAAGLIVNSASRTFAEQKKLYEAWLRAGKPSDNPVAAPGTSAHEGARGRWALDIQLAKGVTPDLLRKVFATQGIELSKVFKERGHFHVEGSRSQADASQEAADRAVEQEAQRVAAFQNEKAGLQGDELDLRKSLITSLDEMAQLERDSIEVSRQKYDQNLNSLVEQGKLLPAEADELRKLNDERAKLRLEVAARREAERKFRLQEAANHNALELQSAGFQNQAELLQGQEQLATTQKERREIERRLVDLQYEEERARLSYLIAYNDRLKLQEGISESEKQEAEAQAEIARLKLGSLDQRKGTALAGADQGTMGPLAAYFDTIPDTMGEIDQALEDVAAGGLQTFADALTNAIVNFQSLGDVGRAVLQNITAALVKMAIQQLLLATIGKALGTATAAATTAQAAAVGAAWAPAAAMAALATLGANAGPAAAALAGTTALAQALALPKLATGGRLFGPGGPTGDKIPLMGSADEYMMRASAARSIGYDALDYMNRTGQLPALFAGGGKLRRVSPTNSAARAAGGKIGIDDDFRRELRSVVRDAAMAMPDVSLYASLDPAEVLQRALSTPAGERALVASLGRNSGRVKATIDR